MDEDTTFQRPKETSKQSLEEQQADYLQDLTSLFDEEAEADSTLGVWSQSVPESEPPGSEQEVSELSGSERSSAQSWESAADATPRWREDVAMSSQGITDASAGTETLGGLSDPLEATPPSPGTSVFADPEPTEVFDLPSVGRVDEVLSLNEPLAGPVTELSSTRDTAVVSAGTMGSRRGAAPRSVSTSTAVLVGLALGSIVIGAVALGERVTLALLAIALLIGAAEWFTTMRQAGFQPPVLLGYVAITALPIAAFWRGTEGVVLVLVFGLFGAGMWYVSGAARDRPLVNIGITFLGIAYVGLTGAFGGLLLGASDGAQLVLTAVLLTAANDVGAFVVGKTAGRTRLSQHSPNKTLEGLVGGVILTIAVALIFISVLEIGPFGDTGSRSDGVILGIVVAVVAPLADLFESALKRDLGVKDMGTILPGHGGVLDRIDALLFVLPATYFTGLMLGVI